MSTTVPSVHLSATASEAYSRQLETFERLYFELREKIDEHARKQSLQPRSWGYAGDMARLNLELVEQIRMLS